MSLRLKPLERPVVGLSAGVLDARRHCGRVDGIGIYTRALERSLPSCGFAPRRVDGPTVSGLRVLLPNPEGLAFGIPIATGIAASRLFGIAMPGASSVEAAIDIYHATDYLVPPLRRTPIVATIHDAIPLAHPEWARARLRALKNWILRSAVPRADLVITYAHAIVPDIIEHYGVSPERIRVIPGGVDATWFAPRPAASVEATLVRFGLRRGYFLFVGTLQPRKNLRTLLDAYDRLGRHVREERQLVIVGRDGWGVEALVRELRARNADGHSRWLDYVDEEALRDLYAGAGLFVTPSLGEGFGLPLLEALASGLAVVATDLPVFREVAGTFAIYAAPSEASALAHALMHAANSPPDPAGSAARRAYASQFDWAAIAARTAAVYRELL